MGGGKGGGDAYDPTRAYQAGMNDYNPDVDWRAMGTIDPGHPDYAAFGAGWDQAAATARMQAMFTQAMEQMTSSFSAPAFYEEPIDQGPSEEEIQRGKDEQEFDTLLGERFDRATEAAAAVNTRLDTQRARAELFGLEFNVDGTKRQEMIETEFSSIWSEENENRLTTLGGALEREIDYGGVRRISGFTVAPDKPEADTEAGVQVEQPKKKGAPNEGLLETTAVL